MLCCIRKAISPGLRWQTDQIHEEPSHQNVPRCLPLRDDARFSAGLREKRVDRIAHSDRTPHLRHGWTRPRPKRPVFTRIRLRLFGVGRGRPGRNPLPQQSELFLVEGFGLVFGGH
jgi:hypothetical protein